MHPLLAIAILLIGTIAIINGMHEWFDSGDGRSALAVFAWTVVITSIFAVIVYWGAIFLYTVFNI